MNTENIRDKRCLVTGATGGLGAEIALEMKRSGCRLFLTATGTQKLERLIDELGDTARVEGFVAADLRSENEVEGLARSAVESMGGVDVLINNAGVFPVGPLSESSISEISDCLDVNLKSAILLCRAIAPLMVAQGWGRIINVASSSAYAGFGDTAVYCASKHGLLGFSRALDDELQSHGVRVVSVSPGSIKTPMGRRVAGQDYGSFLDPREVAEAIAHAASLDGSMIINELRLNRMVVR